jgi:hypothetical protein
MDGINVIRVFVSKINRFIDQPTELIYVLRMGE